MIKGLLIWEISLYKKYISPHLPRACIYTPTCSEYGMQALKRHGLVMGLYLTARRILRCNPFHKGGLDPVPDRKKDIKWLI